MNSTLKVGSRDETLWWNELEEARGWEPNSMKAVKRAWMRTWPTAWGRIGVVRGWMWMPTDLAASTVETTVGIGLSCAIALALEGDQSMSVQSTAIETGGDLYTVVHVVSGSLIERSALSGSHGVSGR